MAEEVRWTLRLPWTLYDRLKALAELHHRSMNGEMVAAVEAYVRAREGGQGAPAAVEQGPKAARAENAP